MILNNGSQGYGTWREFLSCPNFTDYQSRNAELRLIIDKKNEGDHRKNILNNTNYW